MRLNGKVAKRIFSRFKAFRNLREFLFRIATGEAYISWSQFGEDVMLRAFLAERLDDPSYKGFYVDIGANHPVIGSNTKLFYDRGWSGINVDALPSAIAQFMRQRQRDVNVNVGIGPSAGELDYYMYEHSIVNTFSPDFAADLAAKGTHPIEVKKVPVIPLSTLLAEYLPADQKIDFLTIDTEGLDLSILQSNDWTRYRPDYILIEIHTGGENAKILDGPVAHYLSDQGYVFAGQCIVTTLFKRVK